ncbi:hypothetical protein QCA50_010937 [Cerrena zonata]|uniref:Uncharacterized protein n=1 Tax=Cerrena zonata TaxID=2478898 RepID=A0AAW0GAL4_9APHY
MGELVRKYRVVVLGAGGVGKSALTVRFAQGRFVSDYNPTIEEEYACDVQAEGETCLLEIMDTAGAEQFTALNEVYIKVPPVSSSKDHPAYPIQRARGFVLVFSLTQESTLQDVDNIRQQIQMIKAQEGQSIPIVVVGTKMDLAREREVTRDTIKDLAARWGLPFYETSAKNNWHVTDVFHDLLGQMRRRYPDEPLKKRKEKTKSRNRIDRCIIM